MKKIVLVLGIMLFTASVAFGLDYTIELSDSYGDGWNGGTIDVLVEGSVVLDDITLASGAGPESHAFTVNGGEQITTAYTAGSYSYENEYQIKNENATVVAESGQGGVTPGNISYDVPVAGAPGEPTNPSPADDATVVAISGDLTWDFGADTDTYDLWFGEAGSMAEVVTGEIAGTGTYAYSGLSYATGYEWQVIAHNSAKATTNGPVWSFTTVLPAGMIQIGDGTEINKYLPIAPFYGYDYTQTIYSSSQFSGIGADKRIEKLYYNYTKSSTGDTDEDDWKIWIGTTANTDLDAGYIDVATLTEVFDGSVGFGALAAGDGWLEITLTTPFNYDPSTDDNLIIAVDENTPSYTSSSDDFYCDEYADPPTNVSRYYMSDGTNPDPTAPPAGTASAYYPNTRFQFEDVPTNPQFSVNPDMKDFGTVSVGSSSTAQTFTISNSGAGTLTITGVSKTGTDTDHFTLTDLNSYPHDLTAGQSITVDVAFAPTSAGAKTADLTIESSAKVTHTAALSGTGINYNYGQGTGTPLYHFANSTTGATGAPSQPSYSWYANQTGGANEGTLIADTDFVNGTEDDGHTDLMNIFDDASNFTFFGNSYSQMYLSTNGTIGFGVIGDAWHSIGPENIPSADGDDNMIAWCWDDLDYDDTASPNVNIRISRLTDRTIVTFWQYPIYSWSGPWEYITSQVIIYKDGRVFIMYNDDESTYDQTTQNCTIGIENIDGTAGVGYRFEQTGGPIFASNLALAFGTDENTLPVILSYFTAQFIDNIPILNWTTQSETNNIGWNIYRSENDNLEQAFQINTDLIPGAGTTSEPTEYSFEDEYVVYENTQYWYWLESVENSGLTTIYDPSTLIIPEGGGEPNSPEIPYVYGLHQNFPNPFNPYTGISFVMKEDCIGELFIYNVKGQRVRTLFSNRFIPKDELILTSWNGKDDTGKVVSSGIYFMKLKAGTYFSTKKIMLLK